MMAYRYMVDIPSPRKKEQQGYHDFKRTWSWFLSNLFIFYRLQCYSDIFPMINHNLRVSRRGICKIPC